MLKLLIGLGVRRGLLGGSRVWLGVLMAAGGLRALRRLTGGEPRVVYREKLKPGRALVIVHDRPVTTLPADEAKMEA